MRVRDRALSYLTFLVYVVIVSANSVGTASEQVITKSRPVFSAENVAVDYLAVSENVKFVSLDRLVVLFQQFGGNGDIGEMRGKSGVRHHGTKEFRAVLRQIDTWGSLWNRTIGMVVGSKMPDSDVSSRTLSAILETHSDDEWLSNLNHIFRRIDRGRSLWSNPSSLAQIHRLNSSVCGFGRSVSRLFVNYVRFVNQSSLPKGESSSQEQQNRGYLRPEELFLVVACAVTLGGFVLLSKVLDKVYLDRKRPGNDVWY